MGCQEHRRATGWQLLFEWEFWFWDTNGFSYGIRGLEWIWSADTAGFWGHSRDVQHLVATIACKPRQPVDSITAAQLPKQPEQLETQNSLLAGSTWHAPCS